MVNTRKYKNEKKEISDSDVAVRQTAESDGESATSSKKGKSDKIKKNISTKSRFDLLLMDEDYVVDDIQIPELTSEEEEEDNINFKINKVEGISQNKGEELEKMKLNVGLTNRVPNRKKIVLHSNKNQKCKVCKEVISDYSKVLVCKGKCNQSHHIECVGISDSQYNMIDDLRDVIVWICKEDLLILNKCNTVMTSCQHMNENFVNKDDIKNSEMKILREINKLQQKVNIFEHSYQNPREVNLKPTSSYSDVLKSTLNHDQYQMSKKPSIQGIVIKPKKTQSASITKSDVKSKINPATIKVQITSVTSLSSGSVIVKGSSESENLRFVEEAQTKLSGSYDISRTKLRKPRLFLSGLEKKYEEAELLSELEKLNHFITMEDDIKVIFMKQNKRTKKWMTSLEVSGEIFFKLVNRYINLGWTSHFVKEDTHILRCFKCQGYNHNSNICKNVEACLKCAGTHSIKDCKSSQIKCKNCLTSNNKYNTKFSTQHHSNDIGCNIYLRQMQKLRLNTAYSIEPLCL